MGQQINEWMLGWDGITGLEASRAPYSKSHARRLKRKEKEQLTGRLGSLKAALPSIAPTATRTAATVDERSAEEADAAAATNTHANTTTTTATAAGGGATVKPPTKPITSDPLEAPPPRPSRPGQIGEGKGAPLTRSQRRRALYGSHHCQLSFCVLQLRRSLFFFNLAPQESRAFSPTPDTFVSRVCCKSIRNHPNACPEYTGSAQANNLNISRGLYRILATAADIVSHSGFILCSQFS